MLIGWMRIGKRRAATLLAWSAAATWSTGACTFPDFVVPGAGTGAPSAGAPAGATNLGGVGGTGAAGGGAVAGALSQGGSGGSAGAQVGGGGSAGTAPIAGDGGEAGSPELVEFGRCGQRAHPLHCSSGKLDPDETDVDCGGP